MKKLDVFKETDELATRTDPDNDDENQEEIMAHLKMQVEAYKNDLEQTKDEMSEGKSVQPIDGKEKQKKRQKRRD